jgi:hypothetical protein
MIADGKDNIPGKSLDDVSGDRFNFPSVATTTMGAFSYSTPGLQVVERGLGLSL